MNAHYITYDLTKTHNKAKLLDICDYDVLLTCKMRVTTESRNRIEVLILDNGSYITVSRNEWRLRSGYYQVSHRIKGNSKDNQVIIAVQGTKDFEISEISVLTEFKSAVI